MALSRLTVGTETIVRLPVLGEISVLIRFGAVMILMLVVDRRYTSGDSTSDFRMFETFLLGEMAYLLWLGCWVEATELDKAGGLIVGRLVWVGFGFWAAVAAGLWWRDRRFSDSFLQCLRRRIRALDSHLAKAAERSQCEPEFCVKIQLK